VLDLDARMLKNQASGAILAPFNLELERDVNRRKPKVVIPTNFDQLIATALRVVAALQSGLSIAGNRLAQQAGLLSVGCSQAKSLNDERVALSESSQRARQLRDDANSELYDVLAQARDFANATREPGETSGAGRIGFRVSESNGSVAVAIPGNPDEFIALAERVIGLTADEDDEILVGLRNRMQSLVQSSADQQNAAIMQRESSQRLLSRRNEISSTITDMLRRIRDVGFGIAGPHNYESLSTMGFVVQSTATQTNGTTETSEQNWSGDEDHLEENDSEESDSESWNSGPFVPQGSEQPVTPNRSWVAGDPIPDSVTEIEDVYRYTNTIPSEFSPFWAFGPHHVRYGQIPVTGNEVLRVFEVVRGSEFFDTENNRVNVSLLFAQHNPRRKTLQLDLEQSSEMRRAACVLRSLPIAANGGAFGQDIDHVIVTEEMAQEAADRLNISGPIYETCFPACEGTGVAGNTRLIFSNNTWQPGDEIPTQIGTDSELDCFTHTFSNIGHGETETPLEYQRSHVQWPRKGVTKNLLLRYYDKAFQSACGSIALDGEGDTGFVSVNCVTEQYQRDVKFVLDGVRDHEFFFDEIEYRTILFLQDGIGLLDEDGDLEDKLARSAVENFVGNLPDDFVENILCVGSVFTVPLTALEVEQELALSGCVEMQEDGSLRLNFECVCEQFGADSRHCRYATEGDRSGGEWPLEDSVFPDENGDFAVLTLLSDGNFVNVTHEGILEIPNSERLIEALENLGNDNATVEDLGLNQGEQITEARFSEIQATSNVTSAELQNAFDAIRNVDPQDGTVAVSVDTLGQLAVQDGQADDADVYVDSLGLSMFEEVFARTFIAYGGSESTWALATLKPVTVEQLIDEDAAFGRVLEFDLELTSDQVVSREQLLPVANESLEKAWYALSGASVPDFAFNTVSLFAFVDAHPAYEMEDFEEDGDRQVSRHELFVIDQDHDENIALVESVFYSLL